MICKNCGGPIHQTVAPGYYHHKGNGRYWSACVNYYRNELNRNFPKYLVGGRAEPLLEEDIVDLILTKYNGLD